MPRNKKADSAAPASLVFTNNTVEAAGEPLILGGAAPEAATEAETIEVEELLASNAALHADLEKATVRIRELETELEVARADSGDIDALPGPLASIVQLVQAFARDKNVGQLRQAEAGLRRAILDATR